MRRAGVVVLAAVMMAAGAILAGPGAAEERTGDREEKRPRIVVQPARFDFGRVLSDRTMVKEFTIRNHGSGDLVIEDVSTTCGCTAALAGATTVPAGGSTPLEVTLDTLSETGRVRRSVLVQSNDPARPTLEIQLEATVVKPRRKEKE